MRTSRMHLICNSRRSRSARGASSRRWYSALTKPNDGGHFEWTRSADGVRFCANRLRISHGKKAMCVLSEEEIGYGWKRHTVITVSVRERSSAYCSRKKCSLRRESCLLGIHRGIFSKFETRHISGEKELSNVLQTKRRELADRHIKLKLHSFKNVYLRNFKNFNWFSESNLGSALTLQISWKLKVKYLSEVSRGMYIVQGYRLLMLKMLIAVCCWDLTEALLKNYSRFDHLNNPLNYIWSLFHS